MQGIPNPATQRGIIPRAFEHIFEVSQIQWQNYGVSLVPAGNYMVNPCGSRTTIIYDSLETLIDGTYYYDTLPSDIYDMIV